MNKCESRQKKEREKERRKEPKMCEYDVCCDSELNYSSIAQYNFSCRLSRLQKLKRPVKNKIFNFFLFNKKQHRKYSFQVSTVRSEDMKSTSNKRGTEKKDFGL